MLDEILGLTNKRAVVVGGGLGIGRASAELLARAGAEVAVVDIERDRADQVAAAIVAGGGSAVPLVADVLDREHGGDAIDIAAERLSGLDILVNVVGRSTYQPLIDMDDAHLSMDLDRNMRYQLRVCRAFARRLVDLGHGGAIVNIASEAGLRASPNNAGYGAAKAALISLSRSMAIEWAAYGIRVNCIAPGTIATDHWVSSRGENAEAEASQRAAVIPMQRVGGQDEVAKAVLFLASEMSSYVTGETLVLDGGSFVKPG
jgi:NAD(P)-dependent dehydrogenase (short-subunit alcohol dehydrogenase family)